MTRVVGPGVAVAAEALREFEDRLPDGSRYAVRADPGFSGLTQLIVVGPDQMQGAGRLGRGHVRQLIDRLAIVGGLRSTSPIVDRASALAGAARRNMELLRELAARDPGAAEAIARVILDDLKSWMPSLASASGMLGL